MTETLTGKAALLAILQGTHWWQSKHFEVAFRDDEVWAARKYNLKNYELTSWAFSITYILQSSWTRGEPIEGVPEKKTKTITLWRDRRSDLPDGQVGEWSEWVPRWVLQKRDTCGGFVTFVEESCEVEVPI